LKPNAQSPARLPFKIIIRIFQAPRCGRSVKAALEGNESRNVSVKSKTYIASGGSCSTKDASRNEESEMPDVTIVFWRDIPAQVIVGKGRRGAKKQLAERFEQAIDRAAMKVGASDTDAYLSEWRKADPYIVDGDPSEIVESEAARLEAEYDQTRIKALIDNDGWA
jgi:hypothetical protein